MKQLLALTLIVLAVGAAQAEDRYGKQKVVYHVNFDDAKTQKAAMGNIQNQITAVGADNIEVKVVMHGDGISLVMEPAALEGTKMKAANATPEMEATISTLKGQGVAFEVCANTLKGRQCPHGCPLRHRRGGHRPERRRRAVAAPADGIHLHQTLTAPSTNPATSAARARTSASGTASAPWARARPRMISAAWSWFRAPRGRASP